MKQKTKHRMALKTKISKAFNEDLKSLPAEMQKIFLDDLVTAFDNRLLVLNKSQSNLQCAVDVGLKVTQCDL
jgi:prophage DNA circulation protein